MRKLRLITQLSQEEITSIKAATGNKNTICYQYQISYSTLNKILKL